MTLNIAQLAYEAALNRDADELLCLKEQGYCLSQMHHKFHHTFNAISKLAFEGYHEAAEFLVDRLIGSVNDLITGYAYAGNVERVMHWLSRGGNAQLAVRGLAYARECDVVKRLIDKTKDKEKRFQLTRQAIKGYAFSGDEKAVSAYLNALTHNTDRHELAREEVLKGYAKNPKYHHVAQRLIRNKKDEEFYYEGLFYGRTLNNMPEEYHITVFEKAALYGDSEFIERHLDAFLKRFETAEARLDACNDIYFGYLAGGHTDAAMDFFENSMEVEFHDSPLSLKRHHERDLSLLFDHERIEQATYWLDQTELDVQKLCKKYRINDSKGYMQRSTYGLFCSQLSNHREIAARQLLQIEDTETRERLVWLRTNQKPFMFTQSTAASKMLKHIEYWFKQPMESFDCALVLAHREKFEMVVDTILLSLHETAGVLAQPYIVQMLLAHLLGISDTNATKIHTHFFGLFTQQLAAIRKPKGEALGETPALLRSHSGGN